MRNVLYTKYNKLRREEFRISTMICEEDGKRFVEKKALNPKACEQIQKIYENSLSIGNAYKHMNILVPQNQGDRVVFEYLKGKNLESFLVEFLEDYPELIKQIREALGVITDIDEQYLCGFKVTDSYKEVFGGPWCAEGEPASLWTNIDVLFDNIVIKDDRYICLDCEWVFDFPIPLKFVKYRCLFYFYQKYEAYLKRWADLGAFLKCFDFTEDEKVLYMNTERNFQLYVTGKDFENDYIYRYEQEAKNLDKIFDEKNALEVSVAEAQTRIAIIENEMQAAYDELNRQRECVAQLSKEVAEKTNCVEVLENTLEQKQQESVHLRSVIDDVVYEVDHLRDELSLKEQHVQNLTSTEEQLRNELSLKERHVQDLNAYIDTMHSSSWYKLKEKTDGVKGKLLRK